MTDPPAPDPSTWTLPRLRIDRDGEWFHDDAEVTHAGILVNLRENLRVDDQGHYLRSARCGFRSRWRTPRS